MLKPYAYRRWLLCYRVSRLFHYGPATSALVALFAMQRIEITVREKT